MVFTSIYFTDLLNLRDAEKELDLISDILLDTPPAQIKTLISTSVNPSSTSVNTSSTPIDQLREEVNKTTAVLNTEFQNRGMFEAVLERWREIQTCSQEQVFENTADWIGYGISGKGTKLLQIRSEKEPFSSF